MQKQEKITLESGSTFLINKWSFTRALNKITKFTKVLGQPISLLLASDSENPDASNIFSNIPDVLFILCRELEETPLEELFRDLFEGTLKYNENGANPKQVDLNKDFEEERFEAFELAALVFKYQIADDLFTKKALSATFPKIAEKLEMIVSND